MNLRKPGKESKTEQISSQSTQNYKLVFEAAPDGILILGGATGRIDDINPVLCRLLGLPYQEVIGENFWEAYPFFELKEGIESSKASETDGNVVFSDLIIPTHDGQKMLGDVTCNFFTTDTGKKILCTFRIKGFPYSLGKEEILKVNWTNAEHNPEYITTLDLSRMELSQILDIPAVQSLLESFSETTSMTIAILDNKGNVLVSTGWQEVCTRFHRVNTATSCNCLESDLYLDSNIKEGEYVGYKCKNNMWDIVTPLVIGGVHLGNIYTGQFFYDDEEVDMQTFENMAEKFGFNKEKYLAAVRKVPRFSHEKINHLIDFLTKFSVFISKLSLTNVQLIKANAEQARVESALRESESLFRGVIRQSPVSLAISDQDGKITYINERFEKTFGYGLRDLKSLDNWYQLAFPNEAYRAEAVSHWNAAVEKARNTGEDIEMSEYLITTKDGSQRIVEVFGTMIGNLFLILSNDVTERKYSEKRIKTQLAHLTALKEIDKAITTSFDLRISLNALINQVILQLNVDAADVLLYNGTLQTLTHGASRGFKNKAIERARFYIINSLPGQAIMERRMVHIPDFFSDDQNHQSHPYAAGEGFASYFCIPLIVKGQTKGVLEVYRRTYFEPDDEWLEFYKALAEQAAIAIDNATLFDSLQKSNMELTLAYDATIEGWSRALDMRDKKTEGHTQRVTDLTLRLARIFGINEEDLVQIRWGSLLHDIGKMGVSDQILLKPGPLTPEEWTIMRKHPSFAYEMLAPIRYLQSAIDIPYYHHEKWDGSGYPQGLIGEQIPLAARIFAVVDVWDALRTDRPYRAAWPEEKVLKHIKSLSGTHFDPYVVNTILQSGLLGDGKS
jgi:PAS domain S-box-containing protein/putative nucleotidyltransferase with HDIG domain